MKGRKTFFMTLKKHFILVKIIHKRKTFKTVDGLPGNGPSKITLRSDHATLR